MSNYTTRLNTTRLNTTNCTARNIPRPLGVRTAFATGAIFGLLSLDVAATPLGQPFKTIEVQQISVTSPPQENNPEQAATDEPSDKQPVTANTSPDTTGKQANTAANIHTDNKETEAARTDSPATPKNNKENIVRAQFTTSIVDREPTDDIVMLSNNNNEIYFFTELQNLDGKSVIHRWEYEGEKIAEIKFDVKGPRWRVFSSKKIKPEWTGLWSVIVLNEDGNPINISSVEVVPDADSN